MLDLIRPISEFPFVYLPNPGEQLILSDCKEALSKGYFSSGEYFLKVRNTQLFKVYCDMSTDGGGWTVFQRRKDGSVNFYRDWMNYENGFGNLNGEFWLGNKWIHLLTSLGPTELRIDFNGGKYVKYRSFSVGDAASKYRLTVSGYSGNEGKGDMLAYHNNMKFSTYDNDNDHAKFVSNCAKFGTGAWWYRDCYRSNLNGVYGVSDYRAIQWSGQPDNVKTFTEMKLRLL